MVSDQRTSAQTSFALVDAFSEIAAKIRSSEDDEGTMRRITETAVSVIEPCVASSLSLMVKEGPVTRAATSPMAVRTSSSQYDAVAGPCLDAATHERWLY